MSNDATETPEGGRIDLTQFAGITPGPWTNAPMIGTVVRGVRAGEDAKERAFNGNDPDYQALFALPELIAELKRMYAREDELGQLLGWIYEIAVVAGVEPGEMDERLDRVCGAINSVMIVPYSEKNPRFR